MSSRGGDPRKTITKLDDHGLYRNLERHDGENSQTFKNRLLNHMSRRPNATAIGLTDAIATELGLGHIPFMKLETSIDYRIDVTDLHINISGNGNYHQFNLVELDPDGYWVHKDIYALSSGINNVSGITSTVYPQASGFPPVLLERQSSYIHIQGEETPLDQTFTLGLPNKLDWNKIKLVTDQVDFTDELIYDQQVAGTPARNGEWSATISGVINSFDIPEGNTYVNYTYNLFISGQSMDLLGNGVKVINPADEEVQNYMYYTSGTGYTGKDITNEAMRNDNLFWGK